MTLLDRLVGSWILESYVARDHDGTVHEPFGPEPLGLLVYGADGRVAVQAMDPRRPAWASDAPDEQRHAERAAAAADGYIAYAGRFEVEDDDEPFVVHHGETSLVPNWIGPPAATRRRARRRPAAAHRAGARRRRSHGGARAHVAPRRRSVVVGRRAPAPGRDRPRRARPSAS